MSLTNLLGPEAHQFLFRSQKFTRLTENWFPRIRSRKVVQTSEVYYSLRHGGRVLQRAYKCYIWKSTALCFPLWGPAHWHISRWSQWVAWSCYSWKYWYMDCDWTMYQEEGIENCHEILVLLHQQRHHAFLEWVYSAPSQRSLPLLYHAHEDCRSWVADYTGNGMRAKQTCTSLPFSIIVIEHYRWARVLWNPSRDIKVNPFLRN